MTPRHQAVVLAAGGSARLGRPKQLLTREGETLVHRAVRFAAATRPVRLFVVVGADADAIEQAIGDGAHTIVRNTHWSEGLGSSLRAVSQEVAASDEPVLVLACDQPALELQHLQALLDGARRASAHIAVTHYGGAIGVPAVVPGAWFADASTFSEDRGFGPLLRRLPPESLWMLDAPELQLDIDTPEDAREAATRGLLDP